MVEGVENTNDLTLKDVDLIVKQHFANQRVDDIHSHIDVAIDQLDVMHQTSCY